MIKSALALVAAVVVSSGLFAAEKTANIPLSIGGTTNVLTVANHEGWAIKSADEMIATVAWEGAKLVITGMDNGSTTVYAHDADFTTEYVFDVSIATVTIEKTIKADKGDLSNATIRVVTHADCGNLNKAPKILFIGSQCGKHDLTRDKVRTIFQSLANLADVDTYFFNQTWNGGGDDGDADSTEVSFHSEIAKGETVQLSKVPELSPTGGASGVGAAHKNLKAYLTLVTNLLDISSASYKKYDYIVLEFDGNRLTSGYNAGDADWTDLEDRAARCLKPFYEKDLVMWLVDDGSSSSSPDPFYGNDAYFTPNAHRKSSDGGTLADPQWNGYVALMDPVLYLTEAYGERFVGKTTTGDYMYMNRIDAQAVYGDTTAVTEVINKYIKLPSYEAQIADNVATVESKLKIPANSSVTLYTWTSGTAPDPESKTPMADQSGWVAASGAKLDIDLANNGVKATNLAATAWTKIEIKILADDDFLVSAVKDPDVCTYNEETQTYEVNPNKGEAKMTLYKNLNGETTFYAAGAQAAMNAWNFEKRESTGDVVSVTRVYDGTPTNIVAVGITPDCGLIEYSNDEGISWSETNPTFTHAGTYPVWYRVTYENAEAKKSTDGLLALPFTNDTGYVCITQRVITVTADDKTQTYGDADAFTYQITTGTLVGSDKLTGKLGRTDDSKDVGEYDIVATTPFAVSPDAVRLDYIVTFNKGTLTINPAELTVVPNEGQHVCEGDEVNVKFTATGFKYTDSQTKNYAGGSYSLESQALGKQAIVDKGGWDFGKNYKVVSSDTQGRTFEIQECSCVDLTCVYVYRVKLAGKTVKAAMAIAKAATECSVEESDCWAKVASYRLAGYVYGETDQNTDAGCGCETCACNDFSNANFVFWNAAREEQVFAENSIGLFEVLRNGGYRNKVQVFIHFDDLKLAGFGAFNPTTHKLKSASGFFAGILEPASCTAGTCEITKDAALVYQPCLGDDGKWASAESKGSIAYGRWSLTYKSDKVRQAEKDDNWDCLYPTDWQPKAE